MMVEKPRNFLGGVWLLADMSLNIWALTIVKSVGLEYTAWQIVFLRAIIGFFMMVPWILRQPSAFKDIQHLQLHALRVGLSALTLTTSFFAIARIPFALFTAINFTRPLVLMVMAAFILRETISSRQWIAAVIGLIGVIIALEPGELVLTWGLPALFLTVIFGTSAIIVTRKLSGAPTVVMMTFYTAGLSILTLPFALWSWVPMQLNDWPILLAIGLFAQSAQFCFLKAHKWGEAGFLALLSYSSLLLSTSVGYFVFDEIPQLGFVFGAVLIVGATLWATLSARRKSINLEKTKL
jgi:S-adenosylmethionine uptake transporter